MVHLLFVVKFLDKNMLLFVSGFFPTSTPSTGALISPYPNQEGEK